MEEMMNDEERMYFPIGLLGFGVIVFLWHLEISFYLKLEIPTQ